MFGKNRRRPGRSETFAAAAVAMTVVLSVPGIFGAGRATAQPPQEGPRPEPGARSGAPAQTAPTWEGAMWVVRADRVHTGPAGWVFEEAVATWRPDRRWRLRADELVALRSVAAPLQMDVWWARGRVRLMGPQPLYVTGRYALGFRAAGSIEVRGRPGEAGRRTRASVVGPGWRLAGRRVHVDLANESARVMDVGPRTSIHESGLLRTFNRRE